MASNFERGGEHMRMHLDNSILSAAREMAKELLSTGGEGSAFEGAKADGARAQFYVQRSREDLMVLGSVEVEGETFYIGVQSS